jgi:hypothetical protein
MLVRLLGCEPADRAEHITDTAMRAQWRANLCGRPPR